MTRKIYDGQIVTKAIEKDKIERFKTRLIKTKKKSNKLNIIG